MSTRVSTIAVILLSLVLSASRAVADPIAFSGSLSGNVFGARASQQLEVELPGLQNQPGGREPRLVPRLPHRRGANGASDIHSTQSAQQLLRPVEGRDCGSRGGGCGRHRHAGVSPGRVENPR